MKLEGITLIKNLLETEKLRSEREFEFMNWAINQWVVKHSSDTTPTALINGRDSISDNLDTVVETLREIEVIIPNFSSGPAILGTISDVRINPICSDFTGSVSYEAMREAERESIKAQLLQMGTKREGEKHD